MQIKIWIECDNSAFDDDPIPEVKRILQTIPGKIREQLGRQECKCTTLESSDVLLDINGNTVGRVCLTK